MPAIDEDPPADPSRGTRSADFSEGVRAADPSRGSGPTDPSPDADASRDAVGAPDGVDIPPGLRSAAEALFGSELRLAEEYAGLLVTDGVVRGLIGPREAPRIWDRHLLNCAAVESLVPRASYVVDVGSGAGLPGIVLSIARPDLTIVLVEPLARRTAFLQEAVDALGLGDRVAVVRGRAEEVTADAMFHVKHADVVTARAVAPLDRLAGWCLPLVAVGGTLLALKGSSAGAEIAEHAAAIGRLGGGSPVIRECGVGMLPEPTTVVSIVRERSVGGRSVGGRGGPRRR